MAHYKEHWLSLVKFCTSFSAQAATTLGIAAPAFVNFDAHANLTKLPQTDIVGLMNYAWHDDDRILSVFADFAVSTIGDPDNLRHLSIMDLLIAKLIPTSTIPIYSADAQGNVTVLRWMVVQAPVAVEPTAHDDIRSLQTINVKLLSGDSGASWTP